jgi:hypothetical protein
MLVLIQKLSVKKGANYMKPLALSKSATVVLIALISVAIFSPLAQAQTPNNCLVVQDRYQTTRLVSEIFSNINDDPPVIIEATSAVEKAEITQSPDDMEIAITLITAMPEGTKKYDLYMRLYALVKDWPNFNR